MNKARKKQDEPIHSLGSDVAVQPGSGAPEKAEITFRHESVTEETLRRKRNGDGMSPQLAPILPGFTRYRVLTGVTGTAIEGHQYTAVLGFIDLPTDYPAFKELIGYLFFPVGD
jgi:hypothetical protein